MIKYEHIPMTEHLSLLNSGLINISLLMTLSVECI